MNVQLYAFYIQSAYLVNKNIMAPEDTNEVACEKPTEEENVETGEQDISNKENTEDVASVENKKKKKKKKKKKGMKTYYMSVEFYS